MPSEVMALCLAALPDGVVPMLPVHLIQPARLKSEQRGCTVYGDGQPGKPVSIMIDHFLRWVISSS